MISPDLLKLSGIYQIRNTKTGRIYVGSAVRLGKRWWTHRKLLREGKHHSRYLQKSWNKHGEDGFAFEVVEFVSDRHKLIEREAAWIEHTKAFDRNYGYNILRAPSSPLGIKLSTATRLKMSQSHRGRQKTAEHLRNIGLALTGRKVGAELRKRLSDAHRGAVFSDAHRTAIATANTGKRHSEATRKKMSAKAKERSLAYYEQLHKAQLARPRDDEWRGRMSQSAKTMSPEARERINAGQRAWREKRAALRAAAQASLF